MGLYYGIQTKPPCVSWVKLVVRPVWVFHISEKLSSQITHKFCWSQMPPSDHSNKLLIFIFTAYPFFDDRADVDDIPSPSDPRDLPFRRCWHQLVEVLGHEVGTQRVMNPRHQVLKDFPKEAPESTHGNPDHQLGFFNKNGVVSSFSVESFLKFKFLVNKNSSSPCCEETTLKAWPRLQARNLCHLHLQWTGS